MRVQAKAILEALWAMKTQDWPQLRGRRLLQEHHLQIEPLGQEMLTDDKSASTDQVTRSVHYLVLVDQVRYYESHERWKRPPRRTCR